MSEERSKKVLYLHGRPSPHPIHAKLAQSVGADFYPIDKYMRWQDKNKSIFYRVISNFVNALLFPIKKYDILLVDNLHFSPVIAKKLGLLGKRKIVVHLGSHTLYFMYANKFSPLVKKLHLWALKNYDVLLCEGEMAREFCDKMLPHKNMPKRFVTFLGPTNERKTVLNTIKPTLDNTLIMTICNGPSEFRMWYKGLDLMVRSVAKVIQTNTSIIFKIIGNWSDEMRRKMLENISLEVQKNIIFLGYVSNIQDVLSHSSLYLHTSRGDAFPTSTIEAAQAGLPVIVSDVTGTKEIFQKASPELVVSLDEDKIAERISWYFSLSIEERQKLSAKCKEVAIKYTEDNAIARYKEVFQEIFTS